MPWSSQFERPLSVPGGKELTSLLEARNYLQSLPIANQSDTVWRSARSNLLLAAQHGGHWVQYAKLSIMLAILEIGLISRSEDRACPKDDEAQYSSIGGIPFCFK